MDDKRARLAHRIITVTEYVKGMGIAFPADLAANIEAIKTEAYYERALNHAVLDFYRGDMEAGEFIDEMIRLIEGQFTRAWNEGMRMNGLDPKQDMTPAWADVLQSRIDQELNHVLKFAEDIERARLNGESVGPLQDRVPLWTGRYNELVDLAQITTRPDDRFVWLLGATEEHCETCLMLNGVIANGRDWHASGWMPQGSNLACGGWRCDCRLEYTEEPVTEGGIPR